jgi:hypothetical protein
MCFTGSSSLLAYPSRYKTEVRHFPPEQEIEFSFFCDSTKTGRGKNKNKKKNVSKIMGGEKRTVG